MSLISAERRVLEAARRRALIRRMRAAGSSTAIGALSASVLEDDEREARASGADLFIRKPYDYQELLDEIARIFGAVPAAGG